MTITSSNPHRPEPPSHHGGDPESVHTSFTESYQGNPPWEIGKPQPPFIEIADQVRGPLLDCGCGTGNTSIFFAARGLQVTGIDFVDRAIELAKAKAASKNLTIKFQVQDAMKLTEWEQQFASIIDSGLFHIYTPEERRQYVRGLAQVTEPGGTVYLLGFSDEQPNAPGGGLSLDDLHNAFTDGWQFESIRTVHGEINPAFHSESPDDFKFAPIMRFAIIHRKQ